VALSLGLPPAAVNRHRVSMEPGLSSTDLALYGPQSPANPAAAVRPAGPVNKVRRGLRVKSVSANTTRGRRLGVDPVVTTPLFSAIAIKLPIEAAAPLRGEV